MLLRPRVFDDDHLPRALPHREGALEQLLHRFAPALDGQPAEHALISGPSGVGKTTLARYALTELGDQAAVGTAYVRCLGETTGTILRAILRDQVTDPVRKNLPVAEVIDRLQELTRPTIAILDEAADIPETEVLEAIGTVPSVAVVVIAHDPTAWLSRVDVDLARDLDGDNHIALTRYHVTELADILEARATRGLPPETVTRTQLEWIADEVAGVARQGIQALRAAAVIADERGHETIRDGDIEDSFARAQRRIRQQNLQSLPFHHQALYALIHAAGELSGPELHDRYDRLAPVLYDERASTAIGRRSRRNKLQKLAAYGLIETDGVRNERVYRPADPAVTPPIEVPSLQYE